MSRPDKKDLLGKLQCLAKASPEWVYGDLSTFGEVFSGLSDSTCKDASEIIAACFQSKLDNSANEDNQLKEGLLPNCPTENVDEIKQRLLGLHSTIGAFRSWISANRDGCFDDAYINPAISAFNQAWPTDKKVQVLYNPSNGSAEQRLKDSPDLILACLPKSEIQRSTRGFWIVYDLLCRLTAKPVESTQSATTAVVVVEKVNINKQSHTYSRVLWLTVELERCEHPVFAPDPLAFGLTSLHNPNDSFLNALDHAWKTSGVGQRGYRGRWRLQHHCPIGQVDAAQSNAYFPQISGSSAQAAALCAILAASGMIPYQDGEFYLEKFTNGAQISYAPLPLLPSVLVSATLPETTLDRVEHIELGKVDFVGTKLSGADAYRLAANVRPLFDTMLISQADSGDSEIKARVTKQAEFDRLRAEKSGESIDPFTHTRVQPVKNVGELLNHMLRINRWMQEFHRVVSSEWLAQWDFLRNEDGKCVDEDGNVVDEAHAINSGSLEHMRAVSEKQSQGLPAAEGRIASDSESNG